MRILLNERPIVVAAENKKSSVTLILDPPIF
jgi:hypothetical protein